MKFEKTMGYVEKTGLLAEIAGIDFVNKIYYLLDADNSYHTANIDDVKILKEAFVLHGKTIFDKDVLGGFDGARYLVELHEDSEGNFVQLHLLDNNLEIDVSGNKMKVSKLEIDHLEEILDYQDNYFTLMANRPKAPTFNIEIVKGYDGLRNIYYYACNNKDEEEIDLIKVIFIGHRILEEENHERHTFTYEEYNELIELGDFQKSSPSELMNYVTNAMNNDDCGEDDCCGDEDNCINEEPTSFFAKEFLGKYTSKEEEEDLCKVCKNNTDLCDCELWL